ncbi:hypothetical protein FUMI01_16530 [Flavobacterium sp. UMI-01]|nr:hypothetical protein FUMI01_16530 [Flavobacterium sp. UMI-01]
MYAQNQNNKKIFYDSKWKTTKEGNHTYYRIIQDFDLNKGNYTILDYYKSGALYMEGFVTDLKKFTKEGAFTYYYENGNKREVQHYVSSNLSGKYEEWYENGNKKQEGNYIAEKGKKSEFVVLNYWNKANKQTLIDGTGEYEENIQLPLIDTLKTKKSIELGKGVTYGRFENTKKSGEWKGSFPNLKLTFVENYKDGKLIQGISTDSLGVQKKYSQIEEKASFKDGIADFYQYIGRNFRITSEAISNSINGKIYATFIVKKDGKLGNIKILRGLGYGLDEEAIEVIKNCPKWTPAKTRGQLIETFFSIPITINSTLKK